MRLISNAFVACLALAGSFLPVVRAQTVAPPRLTGLSGAGTVDTGQRVILNPIFATGTSQLPYQYQWRKNGADLPGVTTSSIVIESAGISDAGTYAVAVTNPGGTSVTSGELIVRPPSPIVFTTQPRTQTLQVGQSAVFSFVATGTYPRTYQWRKDGNSIAGATQISYNISAVTTTDAGSYTVAVTNPEGTSTSSAASLTVNAATPIVFFNNSPADTTITQGDGGVLSAQLSFGSTPVTFQWIKDGVPIVGASNQQLVLTAVVLADAGKYSVAATNPAGTVTSREAVLTIRPATPIAFASQPLAQSVFQGQSATFSVNLSAGSSPITYQWLKDGVPLAGLTSSSFRLDPIKLSDAGSYALVATNAAGSLTSAAANLTVAPAEPPSITRQPIGATIPYFQSINLFAEVRGTPPLTFVWRRDTTPVGSGRADFSISSATTEASGDYTLVVTNVAGSVTSQSAKILVTPPAAPVITKDPASIQIAAGMGASFRVEFTAVGTGFVTSQWLKNGRAIAGADSRTNQNFLGDFWINNVNASDEGDYSVVLTGVGGSVTSKVARLTVLSATPPTIDFWPRDEYTSVGSSNVQFNVRPTGGSSPLAIQWHRDGVAIPGATVETFYLGKITEADFGLYSVTISNPGGIIASPDFALRPYSQQTPPWVAAEQLGTTVYILATAPNRIERYDLAAERWLPTTTLTSPLPPTAMLPTVEGVYLAYGRVLTRRSLDLTTETPITNALFEILSLFTTDQYLYYTTSGNASGTGGAITASLRRSTLEAGPGTELIVHSGVFVPSKRQFFGVTQGGGAPRVFPVDAQGRLGPASYYYALEQFPKASRSFLFPGEDLVANGAGSIFRLSDMTYVGSLGEQPDDLAFLANGTPVVLRGRALQTISATTFFQAGVTNLPFRGWRAFASGGNVFVFGSPATAGATSFQAAKVLGSAIANPSFPVPVIGANDRYSIDDAYVGDDSIVHVLSRSRRAVVRWSAATRTLLSAIPLRGAPQLATQTHPAKRALFSYSDGIVSELLLRAGATTESQVNTLGTPPLNLTDLGSMIMVNATPSSYPTRVLRMAVDSQGKMISYYASSEPDGRRGIGWEPTRRRFFSGPTSRFDEGALSFETLLANGGINGASGSVNGVTFPVRFSADAAFLATGNGRVFNPDLTQVGVLANDILDAAWLTNDLYSVRVQNGETQVQRWSRSNYLQTGATSVRGRPVRIFRLSDTQLVVVANAQGVPAFTLLNADLSVAFTSAAPSAPDFAGTYFARIASGFGSGPGDLALYVRNDRTAVLIITYEGAAGGYLAGSFTINADGTFLTTAFDPLTQLFGQGISGVIGAQGVLTGTIASTTANFSGSKIGAGSAPAGYYAAPAVNGGVGGTYAIVAGDRRAVAIARNATAGAGGAVMLDAQNRIILSASGDGALTLVLDAASGAAIATANRGPLSGTTFAGLRDDVPRTDRLANISTRGRAGPGDDLMIAGFVLIGAAPRPVLIRAIGPGLAGFGVTSTLADPKLELYRGAAKLAENDNWSTGATASEIGATTNRVGGFQLASGSADAALLLTLEPGAYSAQVSSPAGSAGTALVEVYDAGLASASAASEPRLVNIATRGRIATAGEIIIAGIVVTGNAPKRVLIRAVGPGLGAFGVPGTLGDPVLSVTGPTSAGVGTLASNDDWGAPAGNSAASAAEISAAAISAGAFALPLGSKDASLLLTLQPGNYTAQVAGKNGATGVALVEVYEISN